jgi:hypothetical protein
MKKTMLNGRGELAIQWQVVTLSEILARWDGMKIEARTSF